MSITAMPAVVSVEYQRFGQRQVNAGCTIMLFASCVCQTTFEIVKFRFNELVSETEPQPQQGASADVLEMHALPSSHQTP